jgi:hypothetical protein
MVNISVWAIIGATYTVASFYSKYSHYCQFFHMFAPIKIVQLAKLHQFIGATDMVAPIDW